MKRRDWNKRGDVAISQILLIVAAIIAIVLIIWLILQATHQVSRSLSGIGELTITAYGSGETGTVTIIVTNNYAKPVTIISVTIPGAGSCTINEQVPPGQTISFTCTGLNLEPGRTYSVLLYYQIGNVRGSVSTSFTAS